MLKYSIIKENKSNNKSNNKNKNNNNRNWKFFKSILIFLSLL